MGTAATAQDAVKIQSVGAMEARIPIAVPAFATGPGAAAFGRDLASIIAADLDFSALAAMDTVVVLMGRRNLNTLSASLIAAAHRA